MALKNRKLGLGRAATVGILGFALGSCQPPSYDIVAEVDGTDILLHAKGSTFLFGWGIDDVDAQWLQVGSVDTVFWAIQKMPSSKCHSKNPTPPFSLRYGKLPRCYVNVVEPRPLPEGVWLHVVSTGSLRDGEGFFIIWPRVENDEDGIGKLRSPYAGPAGYNEVGWLDSDEGREWLGSEEGEAFAKAAGIND